MKPLLPALVLLLLSAAPLRAKEPTKGVYLYPHVTQYHYDDLLGISINNDRGAGLGFGYQFDPNWAVEIDYNRVSSQTRSGSNVETTLWQVNSIYRFVTERALRPLIFAGFGDVKDKFQFTPQYTTAASSFNLGAGLEYSLTDTLALRADVRGVYHFDDDAIDAMATVGFNWSLGKTTQALDSDGDGVIDKLDQCRATPAGRSVNSNGCERDSDSDGVKNSADRCPGTATDQTVDTQGCELDHDHDGVVDRLDQCPTTPAGAIVDAKGCRKVLQKTVRIRLSINFRTNSSIINPKFNQQIQALAKFMRKYPDSRVVIEGHTDSIGRASYNKGLSAQRAKAVATFLTGKYGVAKLRVSSAGFGEEKPMADNTTAAGRSKNRRVVAVIKAIQKIVQ